MREEELFWAYSSLKHIEEERRKHVESVYEGINQMGYRKCIASRCLTLISLENERILCRYCESKLSTELVDNSPIQ